MGFEPTRGNPFGLAGRRLSRSAKVSGGFGKLAGDIDCKHGHNGHRAAGAQFSMARWLRLRRSEAAAPRMVSETTPLLTKGARLTSPSTTACEAWPAICRGDATCPA